MIERDLEPDYDVMEFDIEEEIGNPEIEKRIDDMILERLENEKDN